MGRRPLAWFHSRQFPPSLLADAKGSRLVSVCLPARDEEATVGEIVRAVARPAELGVVDEILVVDDGSTDATAAVATAAGARVVPAASVLTECGAGTGKGEALWKAVAAARGEILVFCDADIRNFGPAYVTGLLGPLLFHDHLAFVKGAYERDGGGRVTELVARPLIALLFPELAAFHQPLAGEFAARRSVLEQLPFVQGYGVDLALLIDVVAQVGLAGVAQVHLGCRLHRNRPLSELSPEAVAVAAAALRRAGVAVVPAPTLVRPGTEAVAVGLDERPPLAQLRLAPSSG
jgi:glucosyl-3-phosphoglycerate synthase